MRNKNITIELAQQTGIISADNKVSYNVFDGNGHQIGVATFPFLGSVQETLDNKCCFFGQTPFVSEEGIRTEIVSNTHTAKLVVPPKYRLVYSAMNGQACIEDADTPFCCSVASENYWQS